jgi:DNA gyrase subunit A
MERQKIEDELLRLHNLITELRGVLADINKIKEIVKNEMLEIKNKYSDARRTEIVEAEDDIVLEDLIERHECIITLTDSGYIKRLPADTYAAQNRGGKGVIGMTTKEEDFVEKMLAVNSHSYLMLFTNTGKVHLIKAYQIHEASRTAKGSNLVNIIEIESGEKVTSIISVPEFTDDEYLTMVTKQGVIKKTQLTEYVAHRKGGKIALNLDEGDELLFVQRTMGDCSLIIATADGNAVRFSEENVRPMGRTARGVKGITLRGDDYVTGVAVVTEGEKLMTITEKGYGKRTDFDDFRLMKNRGGHGVCVHNISDKTGRLAGIASVAEDDDVMMITNLGQIVRTPAAGIPVYSRSASGVIVMRLSDDQTVVNFTKVTKTEADEGQTVSDEAEAKPAE